MDVVCLGGANQQKMSTADSLQIDRHLLEECLVFLREIKDKKLTSDQKERRNKMVAALDHLLKDQKQGAANGHVDADGAEEGEVYLPMDEESLQAKQKESAGNGAEPLQENYEPMTEEQLKGGGPPAIEALEDEYMNPDGDRPPEEVEQEDYEDVESALEASRSFLGSGKAADLAHARSPAISPSPSAENISEKGRKKGDKRSSLPFGKSKKRPSESSDTVFMPDPSTAQLSGNLEYRSGRVGRFTKQWVVLEGGCLFIGKSEEDREAIRLISLAEYTLDCSKNQFELKKTRDKMSFKAESAGQLSKWVTQLQSSLRESKGEGDQVSVQGTEASDGPEDGIEEELIEEETYDDVEGASTSQLSVPSIEVSTSAGDNAPSQRLPSSPLPDLPPTPDEEESQVKTSKTKTLLKGLKLKKSKRSSSPMPKAFIKGGHIYMYKKGTFGGGNWEKRYCCITGEGKLCFSSTDDETDKKGVIELRPNAQKVKTKDAHNDKKVEAHPYLMLIAKSTFAFTSADDRKAWKTEIEYSVSDGLELDSEDEEQSAGYDMQTGMMDEDLEEDDIYEAFDEVAPPMPPPPPSSQRPNLPPPRSMPPGPAGIEEELYEDTDEAVSSFISHSTAPGPTLPPRGSAPSGPPLPQRNPSITPAPAGPPLPPRGSIPDTAEEIYDDTMPEESLEIYDDVETAAPPPPPPAQKTSAKPPASPKLAKDTLKAGKGSPKMKSPKLGKKWSPFSRSKKSQAPAAATDGPEEVYDDVETEQPEAKVAEPSPLVNKTTSPPADEVEEVYDDVEGATSKGDELYLPMELEPKKPESPVITRRTEKSSSPVMPAARSGSFNASSPRTRMGSGKVADMMKKFQQDDGNNEIKCKGRIDHMPPGKNAFQKSWCQLEGSTLAFYRSSRDAETTSKVDARECKLSAYNEDFNAKFCLQLTVASVSHKLNCDSKREYDKWWAALEEVAKESS